MPKKVLVIDDSKALRSIISEFMRPYGVDVLEAEDGAIGLDQAKAGKPDLILLDYHMPVMNGMEALEKLKADPEVRDIPVFMLTTEARQQTVIKLIRLGIKDYIVKPFGRANILQKVNKVLQLDLTKVSKEFPAEAQPVDARAAASKPAVKYLSDYNGVKVLTFPEEGDPASDKFGNALNSDIIKEVESVAGPPGRGVRKLVVKLTPVLATDLVMIKYFILFLDGMKKLNVEVRLVSESGETVERLKQYAETGSMEVFPSIDPAVQSFK